MRRFVFNLFVVVMIFVLSVCLLPQQTRAVTSGYYTYSISNGEATITGCSTSISGNVTIPATLGGYPVTKINYFVFSDCTELTGITIPNGVTSIMGGAFSRCTKLTKVIIPDSVINIGDDVFDGCARLSYNLHDNAKYLGNEDNPHLVLMKASSTSITSCQIHPDTKIIGGGAFTDCTKLPQMVIPDSVNSICEDAFYGCSNLNDVIFGIGLTNIGPDAFIDCKSLTNISIPDGVTSIGGNAFSNCTRLSTISIPNSITSISANAFSYCYNLAYNIYEDTQYLGNEANPFLALVGVSSTSITSSTIHSETKIICDCAFEGCSNLTAVTIANNVKSIGNSAFYDCSSLQSITIPDSVTGISSYAFGNCSNLTELRFKGNAPSFGRNSFYNVTATTYYPVDDTTWTEDQMQNYGGTITWIAHEVIPEGLQYEIVDGEVIITGYLGNSTTLIIPPTIESYPVKVIGAEAFIGNKTLVSIVIPEGVVRIQYDAFSCCEALKNITLPDSLAMVDAGTFHTDENFNFNRYGNCLYLGNEDNPYVLLVGVIDEETLTSCSVHNKTKCINSWAFSNCRFLKEVIIPDGVVGVCYGAFQNCESLESIIIPNSVVTLGGYAFSDCYNLKTVTLSDQIETISVGTFFQCFNLSTIVIPNNTKIIDDYAFNQCHNLSTIVLSYNIESINHGAFLNCDGLIELTVPAGVSHVDPTAFGGCDNLQYIWVDENNVCYSSDEHGILYNKNKTEIIFVPGKISECYSILDSVNTIGYYAFSGCSDVTDLIIPESVTSIEKNAFNGCVGLHNVYYAGTLEQWNAISIGDGNDPLLSATLTLNYIPPHDCKTCGDWVVTLQPTFTSNGERYIICSVCGATVTESIDMLVGKVAQWNIVLEDDYAVNFYLQVSESIESTAKVRLTIGNDTVTYNVSALEKTEDGYFRLTANISAAQMNDFITVMVMNGREIGCNNIYSARQYCDTILTDSTYSRYHTLVKEMLNYGAMAQIYFDYDTGYLANEGITGTATTEIPEIAEDLTVTDKVSDLSFYGASLVYRDRIAVRYYFTGDVTGCTFTANGNTYTPVAKDSMHYVEIADILPQNLDQQITLTVTDASSKTLTVTYGPMNYIVRMNQKDNDNLKNLLKALYNYHLAAKALQSA